MTSEELHKHLAEGGDLTNWERVRAITDDEADQMALDDPDNPFKTDEDWEKMTVHHPGLMHRPATRGPQKAPLKKQLAIRLSPDVIERFKATGKGWQARIDDALRKYLEEHPLKAA
jgi:uncharacterized protein (DUF4415 family)